MGPVKVVFFDAAGTLFRVRGSVGGVYAEVARDFGIQVDPVPLERSFVAAFRASAAQGFPPERTSDPARAERLWWLKVVRQAFGDAMPDSELPAYFNRVFELFRTAAAWELYPDVQPALDRLRSRNYRLGVISNFDSRLYDLLVNLGIRSFFENVTLSWQVGFAKPDVGIFLHALKLMGVSDLEALHVGDSPEEDVEGALGAGLKAILIDRSGSRGGGPSHRTIRSLDELSLILR
jgi:putative hydrolase of the HAD superfamily